MKIFLDLCNQGNFEQQNTGSVLREHTQEGEKDEGRMNTHLPQCF